MKGVKDLILDESPKNLKKLEIVPTEKITNIYRTNVVRGQYDYDNVTLAVESGNSIRYMAVFPHLLYPRVPSHRLQDDPLPLLRHNEETHERRVQGDEERRITCLRFL